MFACLLQVALVIALLNGSWEKNVQTNTLYNIEKFLNDMTKDVKIHVPKVQSHNRQEAPKNSHQHHDLNVDRIDADKLNSLIKTGNNFNDEHFDRFLRNTNDNKLCSKVGRCGCKGIGRCKESKISKQKTFDEAENLINVQQKEIDRSDSRYATSYERTKSSNYKKKLLNKKYNIVDYSTNKDNDDRYSITLDTMKHPSNTLVDVIIVNDFSDIDDLMRQNILPKSIGLNNLKKNNFDDFPHRGARNKKYTNDVNAIIVDLSKFYDDSEMDDRDNDPRYQRSVSHSSEYADPKDFIQQYHVLKEKVIKTFSDYVLNKNAKKPNLSALTNAQKRKIRILKGKMKGNKQRLSLPDVKNEIHEIMLGKTSKVKFIPSDNNSNHITVPNWIYKLVVNSKPNDLRSPKRVLPLTSQQKNRKIKNKNSGQRSKTGRIWRRNFGQNLQEYGMPFKLAIQGLGQYNDE